MTTKWSEAAVSEAIESAAKAMGYDTLKPEQKKVCFSVCEREGCFRRPSYRLWEQRLLWLPTCGV